MRIRFGTYGFLDNHLLEMISVSGGYEFFTIDDYIIQKYNFKEKKSLYSDSVSYRLSAKKYTNIRGYNVNTYCFFKGIVFFVENYSERKFILRPLEEAMKYFKDFPRHGYDPIYEATEEEISDIWEERTPIDGFKFDVEPIVYLKKDGVWLVEH